jgi:hypothetical protein
MKFTNDPIYKAFNREKPCKEKVLGPAMSEMDSMPKQKSVPRRRLVLAWGSAVALLIIIIIPIIILSQQGWVASDKALSPETNEYDNDASRDTYDNGAAGIYFDLARKNTDSSNTDIYGAEDPLAVYEEKFGSLQESVMVYYTTASAPDAAEEIYIENLDVYAKYIVMTEERSTVIHLYFAYQGKNYLVVIRCSDPSRLNYFLAHIHAS